MRISGLGKWNIEQFSTYYLTKNSLKEWFEPINQPTWDYCLNIMYGQKTLHICDEVIETLTGKRRIDARVILETLNAQS